jgi:hypothetical protein
VKSVGLGLGSFHSRGATSLRLGDKVKSVGPPVARQRLTTTVALRSTAQVTKQKAVMYGGRGRGRGGGGGRYGRGGMAPGMRPVDEDTRMSISEQLEHFQRSDETSTPPTAPPNIGSGGMPGENFQRSDEMSAPLPRHPTLDVVRPVVSLG